MTGDPEQQRVGTAERQAAVEALNENYHAGRLDPAEHEKRTTAAHAAVTRGDLDALFTDLPGGAAPSSPGSSVPAPAYDPGPVERPPQNDAGFVSEGSWVAQHRSALMSVTPFVALILFFVTKQWWWFLLIPAAGAFLYAGGDDRRRRDR